MDEDKSFRQWNWSEAQGSPAATVQLDSQ